MAEKRQKTEDLPKNADLKTLRWNISPHTNMQTTCSSSCGRPWNSTKKALPHGNAFKLYVFDIEGYGINLLVLFVQLTNYLTHILYNAFKINDAYDSQCNGAGNADSKNHYFCRFFHLSTHLSIDFCKRIICRRILCKTTFRTNLSSTVLLYFALITMSSIFMCFL